MMVSDGGLWLLVIVVVNDESFMTVCDAKLEIILQWLLFMIATDG